MKKKKALRIVLEIAVVILVVIGFVLINDTIFLDRKTKIEYINDSRSYAYQIEGVAIEKDELVLQGWFFELRSIRNVPVEIDKSLRLGISLCDLYSELEYETNDEDEYLKCYPCDVELVERPDINKYYECNYDYSKCGFVARIKKDTINIHDGRYRIVIKPDEKNLQGIKTEFYIDNGILKYINPINDVTLDVSGTDLENIVNSGYCLESNLNVGIYIYQYKKKIYWIADSSFDFADNNETNIDFILETTQFDKLPQKNIDIGLFCDDLSGYFETYEITRLKNCGKYRVCVRDLPNDYSVYMITTGYHSDNGIEWKKDFRPIYIYE